MVKKGQKVNHKTLGEGEVTKINAGFVTVKFKSKTTSFAVESVDKFLEYDPAVVVKKAGTTKRIVERKTQNYAFKCNYCDGGASNDRIGFICACSDDILKYNVEKSETRYCAYENSMCRQYYDGKITRLELDSYDGFVCYEAGMLKTWGFRAGYDNVINPPRPRRMPGVLPGGLCVFTTQFPHDANRYILGAFIADEVYEGDSAKEGYIACRNEELRVELTPTETKQMDFWKFYSNPQKPEVKKWGQGLYRKMTIEQSLNILKAILKLKTGTEAEKNVHEMLQLFCERNKIDL